MSLSPIRVEAEQINLSAYFTESGISFASGSTLIRLPEAMSGTSGKASFAFAGPSGTYDVIIGYLDENDGVANLQVSVGDTSLPEWKLNQNLGSAGAEVQALVRRTVGSGVSIDQGDTVQIQGILHKSERARIDYVEFIPVSTINGTSAAETLTGDVLKNTINGFGGDDILIGGGGNDILTGGTGVDLVSYTNATKGVIASLSEGLAFISTYNKPLRAMPLGDSIAYGILGDGKFYDELSNGGYRTGLWNKFVADGLKVNFVGSLANGPASLGDQDHEGHPGWRIQTIAGSVDGFLSAAQPGVVLLMIGTNNTKTNSLSTLVNRLGSLVDQITTDSPNAQLLVASIPPVHPDEVSANRVQLTEDFNRAIPGIVNSKIAQGKHVTFVDMRSLSINDLTSSTAPEKDDGLHPNAQGYSKIAGFWRDAVLNTAGDKDTLSTIEDVIGSDFDDVLTGNVTRNVIRGNDGNDTLRGGNGNDTLSGGWCRCPYRGRWCSLHIPSTNRRK